MSRIWPRLALERRLARGCVIGAAVFALFGAGEFLRPVPASFTGRWGWLSEFMFSQFGVAGLAAIWFAPAAVALASAATVWRHADRRPADRWYRS